MRLPKSIVTIAALALITIIMPPIGMAIWLFYFFQKAAAKTREASTEELPRPANTTPSPERQYRRVEEKMRWDRDFTSQMERDNKPKVNLSRKGCAPEGLERKNLNWRDHEDGCDHLEHVTFQNDFQRHYYSAKDKGKELDPWNLPPEKAPWEL